MHKPTGILDAIVVVAILATSSVIIHRTVVGRESRQPGERRAHSGYVVGEGLADSLPGVEFGRASRTVIVALKSTCRFCTESMEFYRELVLRQGRVPIVFVGPEPEATISDYLKSHGIFARQIATVDLNNFKLAGTPTLLVADANGVIVSIREGRLKTPQDEQAWLRDLQ